MSNDDSTNLSINSMKNIKSVFKIQLDKKINIIPTIPDPRQCPICYRYYKYCFKPDSCMHIFCRNCLLKWSNFKNQCPLCRTNFNHIIKA